MEEWGEMLEALEKQAAAGVRVKALESRPSLAPHLMPAWDAYWDMGAHPDWSTTKRWSEHYDIDFDWLWEVLKIAVSKVVEWRRLRSRSVATAKKPTSQRRS